MAILNTETCGLRELLQALYDRYVAEGLDMVCVADVIEDGEETQSVLHTGCQGGQLVFVMGLLENQVAIHGAEIVPLILKAMANGAKGEMAKAGEE